MSQDSNSFKDYVPNFLHCSLQIKRFVMIRWCRTHTKIGWECRGHVNTTVVEHAYHVGRGDVHVGGGGVNVQAISRIHIRHRERSPPTTYAVGGSRCDLIRVRRERLTDGRWAPKGRRMVREELGWGERFRTAVMRTPITAGLCRTWRLLSDWSYPWRSVLGLVLAVWARWLERDLRH